MARDPRTKKARRLFRPWEAAEIADNKAHLQKALESPHVEDKSAVRDAHKRLCAMEKEHGVPDFNSAERDAAAKEVKELEQQMRVGMLSAEEMRRNPPGAVDQNVWWERKNKWRVNRWRALQTALHKGIAGDQSRSLLDIERFRPRASQMNMDNAQIPAARTFSFPSEEFKEGWERIYGTKKAEGAPEEPASEGVDEPEQIEEPLVDTAALEAEEAAAAPSARAALGKLARNRAAVPPPAP
jgi:hypothetical protein